MKNKRLYILRFIYREVKNNPMSTQYLYKEGSEILGICKHQLSTWMSLLSKDGLVEKIDTTDYDKRVHDYRITDKGLKYLYGGNGKSEYVPKSKKGVCYSCQRKTKLMRFKGQYYCPRCVLANDRDSDLRLEDYVYRGTGYIW